MAPYGPVRAFIAKLLGKSLMRAVPIRVSSAGKSRAGLIGTCTALCDAMIGDCVDFKHASNLQPEKQMQTTY